MSQYVRVATADEPEVKFTWNGRPCTGAAIHKACVDGKLEQVKAILQEQPSHRDLVFRYTTKFMKKEQLGTGQPIHLAASRGHLAVVKHLVAAKATADACVTRDEREHYDVLHAATYGEGHGGSLEMVKYLILEADASFKPNLDQKWALHLAYQTGKPEIIRFLHEKMSETGVLEHLHKENKDTPLEVGISFGRLTKQQLAEAAPMTPDSLTTFIMHEPSCLPYFLKRIEQQEIRADSILSRLSSDHLATVLQQCPQAAHSLLSVLTEGAQIEHEGCSPPPFRVSFAPRSLFEHMFRYVNPIPELLVRYVPDETWRKAECFCGKDNCANCIGWHQEINSREGKPVKDVTVKVCRIPNIISAEFFYALTNSSEVEGEALFTNTVVKGSILHTYWKGAVNVDITQVLLSFWGLALLILESYLIVESSILAEPPAPERQAGRRLKGQQVEFEFSDVDVNSKFTTILFSPSILGHNARRSSVTGDWMAATGVVDLLHGLAQFCGYGMIGQPAQIFSMHAVWPILRSSVSVLLLVYGGSKRVLNSVLVVAAWIRLLDGLTSAEKLAAALLPIQRLALGLGPACMVTAVGFCAFTHAFFAVQDRVSIWPGVFHESFETLISGGMPGNPSEVSPAELALTYASVLLFMIFFLNVFIGVMGEQYTNQKAVCKWIFQRTRALACFDYLLRSRVLPCSLAGEKVAFSAAALAAIGCFYLQVVTMMHGRATAFNFPIFVVAMLVMIVASYQNPKAPWVQGPEKRKNYLWIFQANEAVDRGDFRRLQQIQGKIGQVLIEAMSPNQDESLYGALSSRHLWSQASVGSFGSQDPLRPGS